MEKQDIKTNYYNFLDKHSFYWGKDNINTTQKLHQYHEILDELLDTSKESVQCLTQEQTEIIRKLIGIYGRKYTIVEISKDLNKSRSYIDTLIDHAADILNDRIERGCASLKDAYMKHEISLRELLNTRLFVSGYYDNIRILNSMSVNGVETIGDLIEKPISELRSYRNIGEKGLNDLVEYIHSIGLIFKDETPIYESIVGLIPKKHAISGSISTALDKLEKEEKECDEVIEDQLARRQKICEARKELIKLMKESAIDYYEEIENHEKAREKHL